MNNVSKKIHYSPATSTSFSLKLLNFIDIFLTFVIIFLTLNFFFYTIHIMKIFINKGFKETIEFSSINYESDFFYFSIFILLFYTFYKHRYLYSEYIAIKFSKNTYYKSPFLNKNLFINYKQFFQETLNTPPNNNILIVKSVSIGKDYEEKILKNIILLHSYYTISKENSYVFFIGTFGYAIFLNLFLNFSILILIKALFGIDSYSGITLLFAVMIMAVLFLVSLGIFIDIYAPNMINNIIKENKNYSNELNFYIDWSSAKKINALFMIIEENNNKETYISLLDKLETSKDTFRDIAKTVVQMAAPILVLALLTILLNF